MECFWGHKCQGWEGPYPMKHKLCSKTPTTARSPAVPPSPGLQAQTSPGSHYETDRPRTFCGAYWVCKPLRWYCWMGDGTPESYWGSWRRQRAGLSSRFPSIHFLHKLTLYSDLEESMSLWPVLQISPPVYHSVAHQHLCSGKGKQRLPSPATPCPCARTPACSGHHCESIRKAVGEGGGQHSYPLCPTSWSISFTLEIIR